MHISMKSFMMLCFGVCIALAFIWVRLKAGNRPTSAFKLLMPSMAMASGFSMFFEQPMRVPVTYGMEAFLVGAILSYPLMASSHMYINGNQVYLKRSRSFIIVMLALLALRTALHGVVDEYLTLAQTSAIFFILAFGMLLPWRIAMYHQYRKLTRTPLQQVTTTAR